MVKYAKQIKKQIEIPAANELIEEASKLPNALSNLRIFVMNLKEQRDKLEDYVRTDFLNAANGTHSEIYGELDEMHNKIKIMKEMQ